MGMFVHGKAIWFRYTRNGEKIRKRSGFVVGQEAEAQKAWDLLQPLALARNGPRLLARRGPLVDRRAVTR